MGQSSWMKSNMIKLLILTLAAAALGAPSASETKRPKEALRLRFEHVLGSFEDKDARYFETLERAEKIPHVLEDIPKIEKRSVLRSLYENCYCGLCQCCDS